MDSRLLPAGMTEGESENKMKKIEKKEHNIPENIADKIHFYGVIETPSDLITFYCGSYEIKGNTITITDLLLDTSATRKSYISRIGGVFFEKMEFINYMTMFFPYIPYKHSKENPKSKTRNPK